MLTKQGIDISFAQGLDTKTDPKRVSAGKFLSMRNRVFNKEGLLEKRNGFPALASLPDDSYTYVTTFKENLTAVGTNIAAYNAGSDSWVSRGTIQPLSLSTLPVIRNNLNQTACDIAVADNGTACCVYLESDGSTTTNKYVIFDSVTGQNIVAPTAIPVSAGTVSGGMRVFVLGRNFVMVFTNTITATDHLQYITVNINTPTLVSAQADIAAAYVPATTLSWDGFVVEDLGRLYIAYNTVTGGQAVKVTYLTATGTVASATTFASEKATIMSVTADVTQPTNPIIYATYYRSDTKAVRVLAVNQFLVQNVAPTDLIAAGTVTLLNMASAAQNGRCYSFWEVSTVYSWASVNTNTLVRSVINPTGPSVVNSTMIRGLGLGSKAFIVDGTVYVLGAYSSPYQPSYFLVNGSDSSSAAPVVAAKLAYENGGGYLTKGLPGVTVQDSTAYTGYLFKDLIEAVNKGTALPTGSQTGGIYSQTGINLASFTFGTEALDAAQIGNDLHLSGGFLGMYDGYLPVEHNFFLWPEITSDSVTWSDSGGSMHAKPDGSTNTNAYYYVVTYEWTDNQGNAFRSAPSVPIPVTTTNSGTSGSVTINIPSLRLTMKTANKVKIVVYRWSVAQQNYYQTTSISSPTLNDTTADTVTFVDTNADATILGNNLLYTTGGMLEDVNAPASDVLTLFDTRLWLVDAEDRNLLWYSKQVIEATPVEMSDLLTVYVPPAVGTATSTGPIRALGVMDDKLIIFKKNAILYINGAGPDNTGANNQYSQPTFVTSTVGSDNQKSLVLMPKGLMFQSDKGIWLLGRGLDTSYIGAPVEDLTTGATVLSAVSVPGTNQVRFTLDTGVTLMYDYFYDQWGDFVGVPCVSSCIYQDMHTVINTRGNVQQEQPGVYKDGSTPVTWQFTTGWIRLGDLQGYQRMYYFYLLGEFKSPAKLQVSVAYDYEAAASQSFLITPDNYSTPFGGSDSADTSQSPFGQQAVFGGPSRLFTWRVFPQRQRCMAMQISVQEVFDASYGTPPGAGFTLSGINAVCGFKKPFRPQPAAQSIG